MNRPRVVLRRWAWSDLSWALPAIGIVVAMPAPASRTVVESSATMVEALLEVAPGGRASIVDPGPRALTRPVTGLDPAQRDAFLLGEAFFNTDFDATVGTRRSGLGPLYNAASCAACHNAGGRGEPLDAGGNASISLVMQLGPAPRDASGRPVSAQFGQVFNLVATRGFDSEGDVRITFRSRVVGIAGGGNVELRVPDYRLEDREGTRVATSIPRSPRLAPALIGMGLLDAIPSAVILERADPGDHDGDGISGRPNWMPDAQGTRQLGRFGWKAGQVSLEAQVATALANEMGVTSAMRLVDEYRRTHPGNGTPAPPELRAADFTAIVSFQRYAGVPVRTGLDSPEVRRGALRFLALGCEHCHRATLRTGDVAGATGLSHQTIHPFTDLLLHDLGDGLADDRPDGTAGGREWRTAPLWGLGLTGRISRRIAYLHDGRARTLTEAILWHDGEARAPANGFAALDERARAELTSFLRTL